MSELWDKFYETEEHLRKMKVEFQRVIRQTESLMDDVWAALCADTGADKSDDAEEHDETEELFDTSRWSGLIPHRDEVESEVLQEWVKSLPRVVDHAYLTDRYHSAVFNLYEVLDEFRNAREGFRAERANAADAGDTDSVEWAERMLVGINPFIEAVEDIFGESHDDSDNL